MIMTNDEIVMEYKQAKAPLKQIGILADQNLCTREEIIEILREAGADLPKIYQKKSEPRAETPEAPVLLQPAPKRYSIEDIKALALDVIGELVEAEASDYFSEQVRGIFTFIKHIEGGK